MSSTTRTVVLPLSKCALILALTVLLVGCRSTEPPPTSPTRPDPAPAATQQSSSPASESQSVPLAEDESTTEVHVAQGIVHTIQFGTANDLTVELPSDWKASLLGPTEIQGRLAAVATDSEPAHQTFVDATGDETSIFSATYTGQLNPDTTPPSMTIAVIPRHNLKLQQYTEELVPAIESAGAEVARAGLIYDVRDDGTPVGIVAFDFPESDGQIGLAGYHLAQLDDSGENLIVTNWVADQENIDAMLPEFHTIAASMTSLQ